jgi:hypothetical protein
MRNVTNQLLEAVAQGTLDKDVLIRDLLGWMSEDDVAEFADRNDYVCLHDEEDDEDVCQYCGEQCDGECDEALADGFQDPS